MSGSLDWWQIAGSVISGVVLATTLGVWHGAIWSKIRQFGKRVPFSFDGYWKSKFRTHLGESHNIEIFRIRQFGDSITLKGWSYSGATGKVRRYSGRGMARGYSFASVYSVNEKGSLQHGAYAMRAVLEDDGSSSLRGLYIEFDNRKNREEIAIGPEEYAATKIRLGIIDYIRLVRGWQKFVSYETIDKEFSDL